MLLAVTALIAWIVMIIFVIVPKWLTLTEICFLYFSIGIMSVTLFTVLDVNLRWVPVTRDIEKSLALDVCRFITIPLLVIIAASILISPLRTYWRYSLGAAMMVPLMLNDWIMRRFHFIYFRHWSVPYAVLMYAVFIAVLALIARWFAHQDRGGLRQS